MVKVKHSERRLYFFNTLSSSVFPIVSFFHMYPSALVQFTVPLLLRNAHLILPLLPSHLPLSICLIGIVCCKMYLT